MPHSDEELLTASIQAKIAAEIVFSPSAGPKQKSEALQQLIRAHGLGIPDASYMVGRLLIDGALMQQGRDRTEAGLEILCRLANGGDLKAQTYLSRFFEARYRQISPAESTYKGPLKDFDGKVIRINRSGILTPVDALLTYEDGLNQLTFSMNLSFLEDENAVPDLERLHQAVVRGIRMWEGDYTVFGGQKLRVRMNITQDIRAFDNVNIFVCHGELAEMTERFSKMIHTKTAERNRQAIFRDNRAASIMGFGLRGWSVTARRIIYLRMEEDRLEDYEETAHIIKHEFGHSLGLGDLYAEPEAELNGVPAGTYPELDSYRIQNRFYRLVMCDHHSPVTNNDIEMVVLAFSRNQGQMFQPTQMMNKISEALGRGN